MEIRIPFTTLLKTTAFATGIILLIQLAPLILVMTLGLLLAISLQPAMRWLERRLPTWAAAFLISSAVLVLLVGTFWLIIPGLIPQLTNIVQKAPTVMEAYVSKLPDTGHLQSTVRNFLKNPLVGMSSWGSHLLEFGQLAMGGFSSFILAFVFMVYFLVDGKSAVAWVVAFFGPHTRVKIERTAQNFSQIVSAYMLGQVVTSVLCGLFVFFLLKGLGVPAALLVGVLAGILDVLPVIGVLLTILPACMFALTVSPTTALIVLVGFGIYHAIENYLIVPWIYGSRLRLSGLVVLISLLVGVAIGGVMGAILILPFVACYEAFEKIWLKDSVGIDTIAEHASNE